MKYTTSHAMGIRLQNFRLLGRPYQMVPFTTLNELFNVQAQVAPPNGAAPILGYLAIGNGGHVSGGGADGLTYPQLVNHGPKNTALINHIPFVLREVSDDLSPTQQLNYGLRVQKTYNGVNYIAYYLRKIDTSAVNIDMFENTVQDGVVTSKPWVPSSADLHPNPIIPDPTGAVATSGDYVSIQALLNVTLSADDIQELMNVAQVLYGTTNAAIISEAALVAGFPTTVSAQQSGGTTLNYTEVLAATVCSSMSRYYHLPSLNQNLSLNFEVGGAESLYGVDDGTTVA